MRRLGTPAWFGVLIRVVLFLSVPAAPGHADPETSPPSAISGPQDPAENIRTLVETALDTQSEEIKALRQRLAALGEQEKEIQTTLSAASLRHTAHTNLLLAPETELESLIQVKTENETAVADLSKLSQAMESALSETSTRLAQVEEQILLNQKDLATVQEGMPKNPLTTTLIRKIRTLDDLLRTKKTLLQQLGSLQETLFRNLKESIDRMKAAQADFDNKISQKKKELLFIRKTPSMDTLDLPALRGMAADIPAQVVLNLKRDSQEILKPGYARIAGVLLIFTIVLAAMFHLRRKIDRLDRDQDLAKHLPRRHMAARMASRSLPLGWTAAALYFIAFVQNFYTTILLSGILFASVFIWLWTRWGIDMTRLWNEVHDRPIPEPLAVRLRRLMHLVRFLTLLGAFLVWMYGRANLFSAALELAFHLILTAWAIGFNRKYRKILAEQAAPGKPAEAASTLVMAIIYAIPLGGIVINLSGYQVLSGYWMTSWGITLAVALWSWLTFHLILEWHGHFRKTGEASRMEDEKNRPLKWFTIQLSYLAWFWISLMGLIFAWYFDKTRFLVSIGKMMTLSISLGSIRVSLLSVFGVAVVLLMTHVLTRIWPKIFQERFLADSGMDTGLKSSITTITRYLIWFLGFLMVLNILGVDSRTMAVAFGGLGIGLGFGLQAIFNNFFSGIILLFERPIQVGDIIEVGGVRGEVKKINVRATLIQTYDNATLLIPNSEFISGQVTNWSFKDFRVRRSINVGVAYGSDVEAVRRILLEIADTVMDVYKYPKPAVLFTDFADSALLFQLRVWTHVDKGIIVETEIRFAIDREFKANQIEIPFPQQDVHIRSVAAGAFSLAEKKDAREEGA